MDQDLQDLKNLNLIELEEKLNEFNNNNKVSFNDLFYALLYLLLYCVLV